METYKLLREIPIEDGYDVVVAGGGPAGSASTSENTKQNNDAVKREYVKMDEKQILKNAKKSLNRESPLFKILLAMDTEFLREAAKGFY